MIPFSTIRSAMVRGLVAHLGLKVIEMNVAGDMPPYPFLTYDFSDLGEPEGGLPAVSIIGTLKRTTETEQFTVSFLSYAKSKAESIENALRARDWFRTDGHVLLKDGVNVVVVNVGHVTQRDVQVGLEWERRNGFEVEFRTVNVIEEEPAEVIESVNVKEMSK